MESGQGRQSSDHATLAGLTLFEALYVFYQEHRRCGDLDGGVDGDRVWMTCTCGAGINDPLTMTDPRARLPARGAVLVRVATFG
jgi:hypothetical protein